MSITISYYGDHVRLITYPSVIVVEESVAGNDRWSKVKEFIKEPSGHINAFHFARELKNKYI